MDGGRQRSGDDVVMSQMVGKESLGADSVQNAHDGGCKWGKLQQLFDGRREIVGFNREQDDIWNGSLEYAVDALNRLRRGQHSRRAISGQSKSVGFQRAFRLGSSEENNRLPGERQAAAKVTSDCTCAIDEVAQRATLPSRLADGPGGR